MAKGNGLCLKQALIREPMKVQSKIFTSMEFDYLRIEISQRLNVLSNCTNGLVIEKLLNEFEEFGFSLTIFEVCLVQQCANYHEVRDLTYRLFDEFKLVK